MQKIDLKNTPIPTLFFSYFIPSLFTMLALSTYSTIDGIFVGRKLGSDALAAIGIAWPVFPIIIAFELLLSFGGAALVSFYLGRSKPYRARVVFSSVFYFATLISIVCGALCFYFVEDIALFLGASARLKDYVVEYLSVTFLGMVFITLHPLSDIFVINDKKPLLATISMIVSAISNIILNYFFIFIFEWGVVGSALATIFAHFIGFLMLFQHFLLKKGDLFFIKAFSIKKVFISAKTGIPQSFAELSAALIMFLFNTTLMHISGERGVAIYSILMYCGIVFFTALFAVAQGMQPIASFSYGARLYERTKKILNFSLFVVIIIGISMYMLAYLFGDRLIYLFLKQDQIIDKSFVFDVFTAMRIYYFGYIFLGINMLVAIYLQSLQKTLSSLIATFFYTIGLLVFLLPTLSRFFGQIGIWISYPLSQFGALFIVMGILLYQRRKNIEK
ncbi:hypothetical protein CQA57_07800 [Helicobacter anseris]|uniref:Multidrug export protein MepA n=1 Tax=Helicobacter anseris TaxID=375926 RepID=A0A3D8J1G0_9HELI|nr:MATE family efflux transporter [Helicobacter anseris]RDU71369.1 hypothetical protein CQA57_07800 [Helicobacter anseris]